MPEDHVCQHSEGGNVRQAGALSITLQPAFVWRWPSFFRGLLDTSVLRSRLFVLRIFVVVAATADSSRRLSRCAGAVGGGRVAKKGAKVAQGTGFASTTRSEQPVNSAVPGRELWSRAALERFPARPSAELREEIFQFVFDASEVGHARTARVRRAIAHLLAPLSARIARVSLSLQRISAHAAPLTSA